MHVVVSYDVSTDNREGRARLRRVAKLCEGFGQRVQKSVFECVLSQAQFEDLIRRLRRVVNVDEDSLRIYRLSEPKEAHVWTYGRSTVLNLDGPVVL